MLPYKPPPHTDCKLTVARAASLEVNSRVCIHTGTSFTFDTASNSEPTKTKSATAGPFGLRLGGMTDGSALRVASKSQTERPSRSGFDY